MEYFLGSRLLMRIRNSVTAIYYPLIPPVTLDR